MLTRDGAFTQNTNGNLVTADGFEVMGYPAVKGVVNTAAPLAAINIPVVGQVQQPQSTTSFGMTATLDSSATVGTTVPGQVEVYDSLGNNYEATVNYTKAANGWDYSVSLPDTLTPVSNTAAGVTTINYNFGANATLDTGTNLTITGPTATVQLRLPHRPLLRPNLFQLCYSPHHPVNCGRNHRCYGNSHGNQLSITGTNISTSGSVIQDPVASANATGTLSFDSSGNLVSPATNIANISFSGLSDGAAPLNMTWKIFGSDGAPTIGQVDATSSTSAPRKRLRQWLVSGLCNWY